MEPGTTFPRDAPPSDVHRFISDMLSQMAEMAGGVGDRRLETSLRLLAVEAELNAPPAG